MAFSRGSNNYLINYIVSTFNYAGGRLTKLKLTFILLLIIKCVTPARTSRIQLQPTGHKRNLINITRFTRVLPRLPPYPSLGYTTRDKVAHFIFSRTAKTSRTIKNTAARTEALVKFKRVSGYKSELV